MDERRAAMRRKEREITDPALMHGILRRATVCRVGMVDGDEPYVVPMNCGWDGERFYLHGAASGRKLDILRVHPRVCIEVEEGVRNVTGATGQDCTAHYATVIGVGTASFITDPAAKSSALNVILRQCHPGVPDEQFTPDALSHVVAIAVTFDWMTAKANGFVPEP